MIDTVFQDSVEPKYYPNTTTFINLLGISNSNKLKSKEAGFTTIRSIELLQNTNLIPLTFDFAHLRAIHQYLFQDLYEWAGKPRSYDVKKGADIFTPAKELPKFEAQVFARSIDYFNNYPRPSKRESATKLARCLGIINIYHPFPEGNGRAQRIFISLLASVFQYSIDWNKTSPWEIVETSKRVHEGSYEAIENLIQRIIVDKS